VSGWYAELQAKDVPISDPPSLSETYRVYHFFFRDPAGYLLEVQRFERPDCPHP